MVWDIDISVKDIRVLKSLGGIYAILSIDSNRIVEVCFLVSGPHRRYHKYE